MIDLHYFGSINYYYTLLNTKNLEFAASLPFQKGWFNNKCVIASANGPLKLSIPLLGGRSQNIPIKDVRIAYHQNWRHQHLRAIETCYGNAPFFEYYFTQFKIFFENDFEFLMDYNLAAYELVNAILKFDKTIEVNTNLESFDQVIMSKLYCRKLENINDSFIKYEQVFENATGFLKNISIIDLIFCAGPRANQLLNNTFTT